MYICGIDYWLYIKEHSLLILFLCLKKYLILGGGLVVQQLTVLGSAVRIDLEKEKYTETEKLTDCFRTAKVQECVFALGPRELSNTLQKSFCQSG